MITHGICGRLEIFESARQFRIKFESGRSIRIEYRSFTGPYIYQSQLSAVVPHRARKRNGSILTTPELAQGTLSVKRRVQLSVTMQHSPATTVSIGLLASVVVNQVLTNGNRNKLPDRQTETDHPGISWLSWVDKVASLLCSKHASDAVKCTSWYSVSHVTSRHAVDPATEPNTCQLVVDSVFTWYTNTNAHTVMDGGLV